MIDAELASLRPGKVSEVCAIAGPGRIGQKNVPLAVLGQTDVIYDDYIICHCLCLLAPRQCMCDRPVVWCSTEQTPAAHTVNTGVST